jgi:hypothetical protein
MSYQKIIDFIESEDDCDNMWKFKAFVGHHGPLLPGHQNFNGSPLENDKVTFGPLNIIAADNPVPHAIHARDNDLLDKKEWKHVKVFAQQQKKMFCIANHAKPWSFRLSKRYMYGFEVPSELMQTMQPFDQPIRSSWRSNSCTTTECSED